jgi:flagellar biosynthesis/type III secretory pathway protein FliH
MTYEELAAVLGRSPEAVRQLAKRKRWRRIIGNDGKARVVVPVEYLDMARPPDVPRSSDRTTPERPPADRPDANTEPSGNVRALIAMLQARITELGGELKEARTTIAELQDKASERDRLLGQLEGLRAALEEMKDVRDLWRTQADEARAEHNRALKRVEQVQAEHVAELVALREQMAVAVSDRDRVTMALRAHLALPWWRRLFG